MYFYHGLARIIKNRSTAPYVMCKTTADSFNSMSYKLAWCSQTQINRVINSAIADMAIVVQLLSPTAVQRGAAGKTRAYVSLPLHKPANWQLALMPLKRWYTRVAICVTDNVLISEQSLACNPTDYKREKKSAGRSVVGRLHKPETTSKHFVMSYLQYVWLLTVRLRSRNSRKSGAWQITSNYTLIRFQRR